VRTKPGGIARTRLTMRAVRGSSGPEGMPSF
jgi:hypothetical protein